MPLRGGGKPFGWEFHGFVEWLEGGGDHPEKWQKEKSPKKDQSQTGKPRKGGVGGFHALAARVVDFFLSVVDGNKTESDNEDEETKGEGGGIAHIPIIKSVLINVGGEEK